MVDKSQLNNELDFPGEDIGVEAPQSATEPLDFAGEDLDFPGEDLEAAPAPTPKLKQPDTEADDAKFYHKKLVGGVEYQKNKKFGTVYDPEGNVITDPVVLDAFGRSKPTKKALNEKQAMDWSKAQSEPTYTGEATKGFFQGMADTVAMGMQGLPALLTSNPKAAKDVMADVARFPSMSLDEREALREGLFSRGIAPMAAFQLRRALHQLHSGKVQAIEDSPEYQSALEWMNPGELDDNTMYAKGKEIMERAEKDFAAAPGWEDSLTRGVASAGGSSMFFLGGGLAAKGLSKVPVVGRGLSEAAGLGMKGVGLATAAGGQMQDAREFLKKNKVDPESDEAEQIMLTAALKGAPAGLSENVPIDFLVERAFNRIPFLRGLKDSSLKAKASRAMGKVFLQAMTEGGQEGFQQVYQNYMAQDYDPKRKLDEGALKSMLIGGIVGGGMQAPVSIVEEAFAPKLPDYAPPQGSGMVTVNGQNMGYSNGQWTGPVTQTAAPGKGNRQAPPPRQKAPPPAQQQTELKPFTRDVALQMFAEAGIPPADIKTMTPEQIRATISDLIDQGSLPEGFAPPQGFASAAPAPGAAPMAPRKPQASPDATVGQETAPDQPTAEPISDIKAQIADMQNPDSPREAVFLSADAWAHASEAIKGTKGAVKIENFDGKGGVLIARTKKIAQNAIKNRNAGVPMQNILGKATGAGTGKPADGTAVVQQITPDGAVVRESLVTPETQAQTEKDFERPGHTVQVVTPEEAIKRRDELVAADNAQPDFPGEDVTDVGTKANPAKVETPEDLATVRQQVNPEPTEGQKAAGNYKHAHIKVQDFDIALETVKGGTRTGKDADGKDWSVTMPADYGRIKGTVGADGDQMDAYIGPDPKSPQVFIVHQNDLKTGKFDEHKIIFGTRSEDEARQIYEAAFSDGKGSQRIAQIESLSVEQLQGWLEENQGPQKETRPEGGKGQEKQPSKVEDLGDAFDNLLDELAPEEKPEVSTRGPVTEQEPEKQEDKPTEVVYTPFTDEQIKKMVVDDDLSPGKVHDAAIEKGATKEQAKKESDRALAAFKADRDEFNAKVVTVSLPDQKRPQGVNLADIHVYKVEDGKFVASNGYQLDGRGSAGLPSPKDKTAYPTIEAARDAMARKLLNSVKDDKGARPEAIRKWARQYLTKQEEKPATEQPKPETKKPHPNEDRLVVETGVVLRTKSGRETSPAPRIDLTTDRKATVSIKNMLNWLQDEAIKEAEADGNDFMLTQLKAITRGKLSQSDKDSINLFLFDDHLGPTKKDVVRIEGEKKKPKPTKAAEPKAEEPKPAKTEEPEAEKPNLEDLQDAGEKIGGARKDSWQDRGLVVADLDGMNDAEKVKFATKENIWHRPDYADLVEKGMEPIAAYKLKILYDGLPVAPLDSVKPDEFVAAVNLIKFILEPLRTDSEFTSTNFNAKLKAAMEESPEIQKLIQEGRMGNSTYNITGNALAKPTRSRYRTKSYDFFIDSRDNFRAKKAVAEGFPNVEAWTRFFAIYADVRDGKNVFSVWKKKGGSLNSRLNHYDTKEEAQAAAKMAYETMDKTPGDALPERPHLDELKRKGPDYLKGRNVTSDDFIKEFGFRAVEFGNWVASDERQRIVNMAFEAFHDLAFALGMTPKAMSLNGTLSIGFGSRGRGGRAAAHYESARIVINMTKLSGAGTLAHEWGHAFDHYLGELESGSKYGGHPKSITGWRDIGKLPNLMGLPPNLRTAAAKLMTGLYNRAETNEEMKKRLQKGVADAENSLSSWEGYLQSSTKNLQEKPDQKRTWAAEIRKAKDAIEQWERIVSQRKQALANPRPAIRKTDAPTEYFKDAKKLSGTGDYWIRGNEMFARAFEAYVFDTLADKEYQSDYLVQGVEADRFAGGYRANPYPAGKERDDINALFSDFMDTIQLGDGDRIEGKPGPLVERETKNEEINFGPAVPLDTPLEEVLSPNAQETDAPVGQDPVRSDDPVVEAFREFLRDPNNRFESITQARTFADGYGFKAKSGTLEAKELEEKIELALVLLARELNEAMVEAGKGPSEIYDAMVSLYDRQPRLGTRTTTSMADQAYSTPVPLAYLVQNIAGITPDTSVYEPTAGNGALVFTATPSLTLANEINDTRAGHLRTQGFRTTQQDASQPTQAEVLKINDPRDVIIGNPPFGTMKNEKNENIAYDVDGWITYQIDHAIVMQSLKAMKKDGRAVFIVGGINENFKDRQRFDAYNQDAKRKFYFRLYNGYNVVDHFTVSGSLYDKQGAGWPVDIIVIEGAGKSKRALPAVNIPEILTTWEQVKEKLHGRPAEIRNQTGNEAGKPALAGTGLATDGDGPREDDGGELSPATASPSAIEEQPDSMGGEPDFGAGQRSGEQQSGESGPTGLEPEELGNGSGPAEPSSSELNLENAFDNLLDDLLPEDQETSTTSTSPTSTPTTSKPSPSSTPPTTPSSLSAPSSSSPGDKLASAATNTVKGLDDVANGLFALFHDPNKLGMGLNFDEDAYKKAKPLFQSAFEHFKDAAKDVVDAMRLLMKTLIDKYNFTREAMARMKPYITRFIEETVEKKDLPKPGPTPKGEQETEGQRSYQPKSSMDGLGTLVPVNMQAAMQDALKKIEDKHGNIDEWVAKELGYTQDELRKALAAEQVDAVAMSLDQVKQDKAFVLGDQTGIGKGRVVAAMLRYALRNNLSPIFVTHKPNLYGDIIRDLNDIGIREMLGRDVRVFMTNAGEEVPLDTDAVAWFEAKEQARLNGEKAPPREGVFLKSASGAKHKQQMDTITTEQGVGIDKSFDIIATTYNQMQTVKGGETERRNLIRRVISQSFLVMDESHNAGGTGGEDRGPKTKKDGTPLAPDSAKFFRAMTAAAKSAMFSSATYAKRPEVMDLYARTDMGLAVDDVKKLGGLIEAGGVPMQQVVAAMLTQAGQYIRRERSFAGITYEVRPVDVDLGAYRQFSNTMRSVYDFDIALKDSDWWEDAIQDALAAAGIAVGGKDNAIGEAGATSSTFSSIMHNMVNQMLLGIKIDAVADMAIAEIKAGNKPVITVSGTMGAFIQQAAEDAELKPGEDFSKTFRDVGKRYLKRTMRIRVKDADDNVTYIQVEPDALPSELRSMYDHALETIEQMDDENLMLSPIDWLRYRIEKAGYNIGEITGRKHVMRYSGKNTATYGQRSDAEISVAGRRAILDRFNEEDGSGREIHGLILNRAGSTGLSAHAYYKFKNKRPRVMIIAQAEANIDDHMQLLGRINRTGQVVLPRYVQAYAEIPAEARPAAVLSKKMASLNANTTASRKGALSGDAVDFINEYGDEVVMNMLTADSQLAGSVGIEIGDDTDKAGMAAKFTGKLTLLDPDTQEDILTAITTNYTQLLAEKEALGENALEAKTLDLEAVTIETEEMKPSRGDSPFQMAVNLETVEVKSQGKAMALEEIRDAIVKETNLTPLPDVSVLQQLEDLEQRSKDGGKKDFLAKVYKQSREQVDATLAKIRDKAKREEKKTELYADLTRWGDIVWLTMPGRRVTVETPNLGRMVGISINIERRDTGSKGGGNPTALGAWSATIALPDNTIMLKVPFHSIILSDDKEPTTKDEIKKAATRKIGMFPPQWTDKMDRVVQKFEEARISGKERRNIFTGNILGGYELARGGQIVNYTTDKGEIRPGVLMPKSFSKKAFLESRPVEFTNARQVASFLKADDDLEVKSSDGFIRITWSYRDGFRFLLDRGRGSGGKYFLNPKIRELTRDGFVATAGQMGYTTFGDSEFNRIVDAMRELGAVFVNKTHQDLALKAIEDNPDSGSAALFQKPLLAQKRVAEQPVFYSALVRAVEAMKQEKAPKGQWMGAIRNAQGVKAEEIAWLGLEDWLGEQSGLVSKQSLLDFLRANQVQVQEVVKSANFEATEDDKIRLMDALNIAVRKGDLTVQVAQALLDGAKRGEEISIGEMEGLGIPDQVISPFRDRNGGPTKFPEYQLPGGENYREMLLTLPKTEVPRPVEDTTGWTVETVRDNSFTGQREIKVRDASGAVRGMRSGFRGTDSEAVQEFAQSRQSIDIKEAERAVNFTSSHWFEPNVLAHVRFNERTTDGKRTLFIEEIQSDWHQKGRKQGYKKEQKQFWVRNTRSGNQSDFFDTMAEAEAYRDALPETVRTQTVISQRPKATGEIPDAPFKTTWPELALKRMVRWAAENGFDQVAWTPGEEQVDRYEEALRNAVDEVDWFKTDAGIHLTGRKNGKVVVNTTEKETALSDAIGKAMADQIIADPSQSGKISGDGLTISDTGMATFYDNMLVNAANKLGKKFGAKVKVSDELPGRDYAVVKENAGRAYGEGSEAYKQALKNQTITAHTLPITPDMRGSVMEGQPLFRNDVVPAPEPMNKFFETMSRKQQAEVEKQLQDTATRILGHRIRLELVDGTMDGNATGQYDPKTRTIEVAIKSSADFVETMGHEALHALRDLGVFTKAEWQLLKREAAAMKLKEGNLLDLVRNAYDADYRKIFDLTEEQHEEVMQEEAVAFLIGSYVGGYLTTKPSGRAAQIIDKMIEFLQAVINLSQGLGFKTGKGVVRDIIAGKMKERQGQEPGRGFYMKGRRTGEVLAAEQKGLQQRKMPLSQPNRPVSFQEPEDSVTAVWNSNQPLLARMAGAAENALLPIRRDLQDSMQDWSRVERAIEEQTGNPLNPALRVYQAETLYAGRAGERLEDLRMDELEPLAEEMHRLKIDLDTLDDFLIARHAPERNAHIASINPSMPDGGSGMMNADAQAVMARLANQGKIPALQQIAQRIDGLVSKSRRNLLNGGIIDQNTFQQWSSHYQSYVPLRGDPSHPDDGLVASGKKYDTRTKVDHRAMGRRSRAESPTAWVIAQVQQSVILSEKARVGRAALRLARRFPNKNLWEVNQVVPKRIISKATGLVTTYMDNSEMRRADNVLAVREGGNLYYVTLHHDGLAKGLKNMDGSSAHVILRAFQTVQRFYALMRTGLDPQFFIPNFLRDLQTAGVHIAADQGARILKETLRDIPKAMRGVWRGERGNLTGAWAQAYRDFAQAGGKVGVFGLENIDSIKSSIQADIALLQGGPIMTPYKAGRSAFKFMMDLNAAVENAVRLSLYAAMRRNGYSRDDAAYAAKEVTVNFNRKGNLSRYINAAYVFFNASVQGTTRVAKALVTSKLARRVAMGLFLGGMMQDIMNSMMSGDDDDDGENDYDQIPEWIRERNYIVMLPWGEKGNRLQIPMPWVYNVFHYAGTNVGRTLRGKVAPTEAAANVLTALLQAANPLQSNSLAQTLTPTALDPVVELYANKDWKGDPIMPEESRGETPKPDSQRYWNSVNPTFKEAARIMNEMSGGDEIRPGAIDVSPETLEYLGEFLGGGVAATYNQVLSTAGKVWRGEEIDAERVPFARKVYGTLNTTQARNEYYTMRESVKLTMDQLEFAASERNQSTIELVKAEYAADLKAAPLFKETDKVLARLRKARNQAQTDEQRTMIQEQMDTAMTKARKAYRQMLQEAGQK